MSHRNLFAITLLLSSLLLGACSENPVGRRCFIGDTVDGGAELAIVTSPALECESRACLHQPITAATIPNQYADLCTAECSSDDDCDKVPSSPCETGFACAIPVIKGDFCCRKLCVCKDYIAIPDGGVTVPTACDPENSVNTCCNLPGRDVLPQCQAQ